ncbi:MAG: hypothetical protein PHN74_02250 [Candidatus Pacebacteria bacterium]|nr:hypothetical protein [Candidatus Paceibacterota bacterium]
MGNYESFSLPVKGISPEREISQEKKDFSPAVYAINIQRALTEYFVGRGEQPSLAEEVMWSEKHGKDFRELLSANPQFIEMYKDEHERPALMEIMKQALEDNTN